MSKQIDKIKYIKVKASLLKGNTAKQSLLDAGYTPATASHSTANAVVKRSQEAIIAELSESDVTVEMVIAHLREDRALAHAKGDIATMVTVDALLGKYLAMFTDKSQVDSKITSTEDKAIVDKYIHSNRIRDNSKVT